jgi:hypothetical protein
MLEKIVKWKKNLNSPSKDGIIEFVDTTADSYLEIRRATDVLPEWYKKMSPFFEIKNTTELTVKKCIPILDALTTGYVLVTTSDYYFNYDEKTNLIEFSGENIVGTSHGSQKAITFHPTDQIGEMPVSPEFIKYAFKWGSDWLIKTPKGYSTIFTHPFNAPYLPFYTLTGVVDTDTYTMPVLFPFLMKNNFIGVIEKGTPVVQIIPFKRDDWKKKIYDKISSYSSKDLTSTADVYFSKRFNAEGKLVGGVYKKEYRKKKKYL